MLSGVTDGEQGASPPSPRQAECKIGAPFTSHFDI